MLDKRDTVLYSTLQCTARMQERWDAGLEGCRYEEKEGYMKGGIQDKRNTGIKGNRKGGFRFLACI